jgi:anti-sigma factor RsiW
MRTSDHLALEATRDGGSASRLTAQGFELIGGGCSRELGPVAQFMYHDASGQRLTLYVSTENASNRDTAFRFAQEGPGTSFTGLTASSATPCRPGFLDTLAGVATAVTSSWKVGEPSAPDGGAGLVFFP